MEDASVPIVDPLQSGDETSIHNSNNLKLSASKVVDQEVAEEPGNDENAKNGNHNSKLHLPRFQVFKKMRLGRSPFKSKSKMSKSSIGSASHKTANSQPVDKEAVKRMVVDYSSDNRRHSQGSKSSFTDHHDVIPSKAMEIGKRVLFDTSTDSLAFSPSGNHDKAPESVLPSLEKAPSAESSTESTTETSSSSVSTTSRNWLDAYGKQTKGDISKVENQHSSKVPVQAPPKDPRFHSKRKTQPQPQPESEERKDDSTESNLFPSDPMNDSQREEPQVFLAPVIVPPASTRPGDLQSSLENEDPTWKQERYVEVSWSQAEKEDASWNQESNDESSWNQETTADTTWNQETKNDAAWNEEPVKEISWDHETKEELAWKNEPKEEVCWGEMQNEEPSHNFASPPKRSSVFELNKEAIAAAQEAPPLAPSLSQETSFSESNSVAMSSITSSTASSAMASTIVRRLVVSSATKDNTKARIHRQNVRATPIRATPIRIKPRVKPQEVQATDQGYASVAKLSAWLADDPTSTKKVRHIRRGANVIAKSRQFEKDLEDVIVEENNISSGAVREKKDWLKSAFVHQAKEHDELLHHDPNRHMMMMRTRPVNDDDCARSEFVVTDDAASSLSVGDKKRWLQNAFKKEDDIGGIPKHTSYKAQSDIGPVRECRDDVTARAKKLWQQKSEKRAGGPTCAHKPPKAPSPYRKQPPPSRDAMARTAVDEKMRGSLGSRASAPSHTIVKAASAVAAETSRNSVVGIPVEEDTTPVDFRAARELLIQRSKENGNDVNVASKVQRRANKFETINKDTRRRSSKMGLLKPTWESNAETELPSDAYTKAFREDIPRQRSFDELP